MKWLQFVIDVYWLVIALMFVSCTANALDATFTKTYQTSKGTITFNHQSHSTLADCVGCHEGGKLLGGVVNKNVGHNYCRSCHQKMNSDFAPVICTGCHVR